MLNKDYFLPLTEKTPKNIGSMPPQNSIPLNRLGLTADLKFIQQF